MIEFPVCVYSGVISPDSGKRMCRLPRKVGKRTIDRKMVTSETCKACPFAGCTEIAATMLPICKQPAEDVTACYHRGSMLRTVTCEICGDRKGKQVPIHACDVHGECSLIRFKAGAGPQACLTCKDREPSDLPPLTGPLGLAWFVWPRTETRELWLEQQSIIRAEFDRFDGPKRLYIATGDTSEGEIDPHGWDEIRVAPNDPAGREVPGWRWLMESAASEPGATVFLHAKGVWRGCNQWHLRRWWELAYQTMLDVPRVREALERSIIAGVFRQNFPAANLDGVPWHFAGTFYAVRNSAIRFPDSKAGGWYAEAWPSLIAKRDEAACIAFDGVRDLYQSKNWKT